MQEIGWTFAGELRAHRLSVTRTVFVGTQSAHAMFAFTEELVRGPIEARRKECT
jgi:hypothetical protein